MTTPAFHEPGSATIDDFHRIDMRVGRITAVEPFPAARKPAYRLTIDFGPGGIKRSSAQLPPTYPDAQVLVGRLIVAVVNFAPAQYRRLPERGAGPRRTSRGRLNSTPVGRFGRFTGRPDRLIERHRAYPQGV